MQSRAAVENHPQHRQRILINRVTEVWSVRFWSAIAGAEPKCRSRLDDNGKDTSTQNPFDHGRSMGKMAPIRSRTSLIAEGDIIQRWSGNVFGALLLGLFLVFVVRQIQRPLMYDEVNFSFAAEAIARIGIPFANVGFMSDRYDFSQREQWALWHPPLYLYALALSYKLLGVTELAGRSIGVVCTVLSAILVGYIGRRIAAPSVANLTGILAFALFLVNPLTVQSALILDIDGTVLLLFVTLLTALYVRHVQQPSSWDLPVLAVVFAVALWAKMTTPLGLVFAIVGHRTIERRPLLGLREAAVVGIGGAAVFLVTYTVVVTVLQMPWGYPFATLWQEFTDASESTRLWRESFETFIAAVSPVAWWISPALLVLGLAALVQRLRDFLEHRKPDVIDVILILAVGIYCTYLIKLAGLFPKYHITAIPFLCLAAAWLVGRVVGKPRLVDLIAWSVALVVTTVYYSKVPANLLQEGFGPLDTLLIIQPLMILAVMLGLTVMLAGGPVGRQLAMVLVTLVLGWSLGIDWRQSRADFSTNYWYGSHGQREAAAMLDSLVRPDEFWGGAKEVAYYAGNQHYIDQDTIQYWIEHFGGGLEHPINGYVPRVLAVWTGHPYVYWIFHTALEREFQPVGGFGTYTVLVRRNPAEAGPQS
jgi:4-amino-4-deoxy-L-arabinose transferase-like glycosyltransferase